MTIATRLRITLLLVAACGLTATAQQSGNEEFARRQYESGMTFFQNHRYAEALKDLQAVVESFATTSVADNALLQIAQYQLDIAHDIAATQASIDKLLKDYPNSDAAPMGHVLSGRLALTKGHATTDVDAALASFERVSRLFPGTEAVAAAGYYSGDTLRIVRRTAEALDRFRRVELEYPRSQWAARSAIGAGYCLVQLDRAVQALPEVQWVRQQFPGTPVAQEALNLNTIIYRLYLRPPAQPSYGFSGRTIGDVRTDYQDVVRLSLESDGRLLLGHKGGVTIFDDKGAVAGMVPAKEPSSFFVDEKGRIVVAKAGTLTADKGETQTLFVPEKDGKARELDQIPAVLINYKGDRIVADAKGHSVLRMGPDGKYVGPFANLDALRMIVNGLGDIALLEKGTKTVLFSDRESKVIGKLVGKGPGYELDDPVDIAFDVLDQLYVLDRGKGAVLVFGPKNKFITSLSIPEKNPGAFPKAVAMSIDPAGRLFIFDERAKRIQVYQ
jgi:outer membrane protein assembly factor BamD (BamD/ComL family)